MSLTGKILKGSLVITIGEIISQLCSLLRNVILARILTKADFGTAALLGITVSMFEIGARLSIEQCLIQSKRGEHPQFMAVAHFLQVMLGLISGVLLFAAARPMAVFFDVTEATWALQLLAVLPVLRSLSHLDVHRMAREMRFAPGALIDIVPHILITIAVWPLAHFWNSYAILVWLFIGKQLASTLATHLVAERPYRWTYDPEIIRDILRFGWPMLINGFLLFGIMQGDRFAVGIKFSVSELGVYAIAGSVALLPTAMLLRLSTSIMLPVLASVRDDAAAFRKRLQNTSQVLALFSSAYAVMMIVGGEPLVALLFGAKYHEAGALVAWLSFGQALRLLRNMPTIASMAKGDTKNLMYSNLLRLTGLGLAFPLAMAGASLSMIAACAAVGEGAALLGSIWVFTRKHHIPPTLYLPAYAMAGGFILLSSMLAWLGVPQQPAWIPLSTAGVMISTLGVINFVVFPEVQQRATEAISRLPTVFRKLYSR